MNAKRTLSVVLLVVLAAVSGPAAGMALAQSDEPGQPVVFYGSASTASGDVPQGTTIVLTVDGERQDSATVDANGNYATSDPASDKLETHTNAGSTITFHIGSVDGPQADETLQMDDVGSGVFEQDLTGFEESNIAESITLEVGGGTGTVSINNGDSASVTVTATFADGSSQDVSGDATLSSSDTGIVSIDGTTVIGESTGSATLTADYQGLSDSVDIDVTEAGTDTGDDGGDADTGGGGGGQPSDGGAPTGAKSISTGISGTQATVTLSGGLPVTEVGFGSQTQLSAQVTVSEIGTPPIDPPVGQTFVTGADITFDVGDGDDVETVKMGVAQSRLDELDVAADHLVMAHYDITTDEWAQLETTVVEENDERVLLESPSAGFSTYAIFAEEQAETTTQQTTEETTTEETTTEEQTTEETTTEAVTTTEEPDEGGPGPVLIGGIVVVVLAIIAALYLAFGRE